MKTGIFRLYLVFQLFLPCSQFVCGQTGRPRARDLGIQVGVLSPGALNAITDVAGVRVGHTTLIEKLRRR